MDDLLDRPFFRACPQLNINGDECMKKWFDKLGNKMAAFMQGRYGNDELNMFIYAISLVFIVLSIFPHLRFLQFFAMLLLFWSLFRSYSRNVHKRQKELAAYFRIQGSVTGFFRVRKNMWTERKTHRYYKCPECKAMVRIKYPGKGKKISVRCPKCGRDFIKKT